MPDNINSQENSAVATAATSSAHAALRTPIAFFAIRRAPVSTAAVFFS